MLRSCYGLWCISYFLLQSNPDKTVPKHNIFWYSRKSYAIPSSPNGSAGGGFLAMPLSCGISPLTCTIFDPNIFLIFSKSIFFHISPTSPKKSIMGKLLDFALKIAHRGNTGSHRGKRKLFCLSKN